jgi:hypothetical protein
MRNLENKEFVNRELDLLLEQQELVLKSMKDRHEAQTHALKRQHEIELLSIKKNQEIQIQALKARLSSQNTINEIANKIPGATRH